MCERIGCRTDDGRCVAKINRNIPSRQQHLQEVLAWTDPSCLPFVKVKRYDERCDLPLDQRTERGQHVTSHN